MAQTLTTIARPSVVIIDDSKFVRTTFNRILKPSLEVREEVDGEAGWNRISTDPSVVLVLCDISMPGMDGFGVLALVRGSRDGRIRHLPVIIISGDEDEATRKRARDCGANDFIAKTADATEVLSRIDNQLRLVRASEEASENRKALAQTATHDPLTGAFTLHYILTEGRKKYAYARRHGGPLSVISFRIVTHRQVADKAGKDVADQLLARIAKAIQGALRAEDSMGRAAEDTFTVISGGTSAQQAAAFARRLHDQFGNAQINFHGHALEIQMSIGLAALGVDSAESVEDLMRIASSRLTLAVSKAAEHTAARETPGLPAEIERALLALEQTSVERLGEAANEVLKRLLPFLQAACKRLHVELPAGAIVSALNRPK